MKSAVFYGRHDIRVEDTTCPKVGEHDVLIEVKACGICGTDVHIYEGDKGAAEVTPPTILGHEFAGVVVEVGSAVQTYQIGDRVCIDPNCYCGTCTPCRNGLVHFCEHMIGYGTTVHGGFAQFCAVNERQVYKLGEHTTFAQGAMAEPVACCLHGIDLCNMQPGQTVIIIGAGMIGLLMVQLAKLAGAANVICLEPVAGKRDIAIRLGADICIDPIQEHVEQRLLEEGVPWVHTVIECVGRPATIQQAISLCSPRGTIMMFGLTKPDEEIHVKPFEIFQKEITLTSSFINPLTQQRALDLIDSGRLDVSSMIYDICSLEKLEDILRDPTLRAKGKYLIDPQL